MRIVADANMPGLAPFEALGTVKRVEGRHINAASLADAEVLLVRSVTTVDARLLAGSRVRFVGSATIGTDHVDRGWLQAQGIPFAHAPGCNARAVAEYVLQAVLLLCQERQCSPLGLSAGIVGMGNVGRRVARWLAALGMEVIACDPPLQRAGEGGLYPLQDALACDLISLHVPLNRDGQDATVHLLDEARLASLKPQQMLINTCRGPVIDNQALHGCLGAGRGPLTILDVWEGEPVVSAPLFRHVLYGSPHIAGYSLEGKLAGTAMLYDAFAKEEGVATRSGALSEKPTLLTHDIRNEGDLLRLLNHAYRLPDDHRQLEQSLLQPNPAQAFDALRKHYPVRHEMHYWQHQGHIASPWQAIMDYLFAPG